MAFKPQSSQSRFSGVKRGSVSQSLMLVNASPYGNWVLLTFEVPCGARTLPAGIRANGFMTAVIDMSEDKPLLYHGKSDFNFPSGSNCGYQSKTSSFTRRHVVPNLFDCRSSVENKRRYFENSLCRIFPYRELANMNIKFLKITKTSLKYHKSIVTVAHMTPALYFKSNLHMDECYDAVFVLFGARQSWSLWNEWRRAA